MAERIVAAATELFRKLANRGCKVRPNFPVFWTQVIDMTRRAERRAVYAATSSTPSKLSARRCTGVGVV
jgi:hypothetical protein